MAGLRAGDECHDREASPRHRYRACRRTECAHLRLRHRLVVYAGGPACCSYGLHVIIDHGNGIQTVYAHLSRIDVWEGQLVYQRTQIGLGGNTGHSRGPHLHFEIRYGERHLDPIEHLPPACETPDSIYPLYSVLNGDCALAPGSRYQRSLETAVSEQPANPR